jgi:hypothetical protein
MIVDGYATTSDLADSTHAPDLSAANDDASAKRIGLWRTCGTLSRESSTVAPTSVPPPSLEQIAASYLPLTDVRELAIRPGNMLGDRVAFSGTIKTINVAGPGMSFTLGDLDPKQYESELQIDVPAPDGTTEYVFVGYDGDTESMFEGTWVTVYGTVKGTQTFQNAMGGAVTQPLVAAELVTAN